MSKKIISIIGARPQFIKLSMLSRVFRKHKNIREIIVHTGQHFDKNMSHIFFDQMQIPAPDYNLGIHSAGHGEMTGKMLVEIEKILLKEKPDIVLIYGDTNSTLAGVLAASKLHVPVAHVEAGLRSFNKKMPEEINRLLTDHAPSAVKNLKKEGIDSKKIHLVGDVMYDVALFYEKISEKESEILHDLELEKKQYILATIHRQENTDSEDRLKKIIEAFIKLAENMNIVFPVHPRTKYYLKKYGLFDQLSKMIVLIDPVGFLDMIMLEKHAKLIITDSGGVQKEAYFYKVPCVTFRDETEWIELIEHDWNKLISMNNLKNICQDVIGFIGKTRKDCELYGNGNASYLIFKQIMVFI
jgi:UDP-GlcNAc3NAcA epimerase